MRVIKRNAIRCLKCGDVIESKSVHDWVQCSCGACYVDGGKSYARIGGDIKDIDVMIEYEEVPGATMYIHRGSWFNNSNIKVPMLRANELISYYEDLGYTVKIDNEDGNEVYRSKKWEDMDE